MDRDYGDRSAALHPNRAGIGQRCAPPARAGFRGTVIACKLRRKSTLLQSKSRFKVGPRLSGGGQVRIATIAGLASPASPGRFQNAAIVRFIGTVEADVQIQVDVLPGSHPDVNFHDRVCGNQNCKDQQQA